MKPPKTPSSDLQDVLLQLLDKDDKLVVLASSLTTHTLPTSENRLAVVVEAIATRQPARFYGLGELLEELVPTVNRLSTEGLTPVVLLSSADLVRGYAGISAVCLQRLPVLLIVTSERESSQTLISDDFNDLSLLLTLPSLIIGAPNGLLGLKSFLQTALTYEEGPAAIVYPLNSSLHVKSPVRLETKMGIGKAQMLVEGKDLAILALGAGVVVAQEVARELEEIGLLASVIDGRWARPLDTPLITAIAAHFPCLVTLEEGALGGGFGTAILELLERNGLFNVKIKRLSVEQPEQITSEIINFLKKLREADGFGYQSAANYQLKPH